MGDGIHPSSVLWYLVWITLLPLCQLPPPCSGIPKDDPIRTESQALRDYLHDPQRSKAYYPTWDIAQEVRLQCCPKP